MTPPIGLLLAAILALGFLAQWLAWRVQLPAILFLLLVGLLLGPVFGVLDPDPLLGDLLFPVVSLSVAVILFEGSVNLRFSELAGIGHAVRGMVTYGALIAVACLSLAAHWLAHLRWELAFLFGALACVTGPTVIAPMLRTVRPNRRISNLLRWEGIVIDPLGALIAVLVFEAIVSREQGHSLWVFLSTVGCGAATGIGAALILGFLLRRQYVPEYLQAYATLALVLGAFSLSDALARESGLLTVTFMGIVLGNMRDVHIDDILDFKEHLSTLLVSMLFVILAARLQWPLPEGTLLAGFAVYLAAQLVIRPLSVAVAALGSSLEWRERALVAWIAPRGIVAAAVSALFALKLQELGVPGAERLVPLVFILIIATVIVQSATSRSLAKLLGVAAPDPDGVLVFGANIVARTVA
ncbi:MAG: sodium:proton antiporter, partial [Rhodanobacteraceae bacterium]